MTTTVSKLYYEPARPSAFSNLQKLLLAMAAKRNVTPNPGAKRKKTVEDIRDWLEKQDAYTLYRPVRKPFVCNPYNVTKVINVWECDLLDVQAYASYNYNYRYIISVIDVFSKFLYMIPIKTKSGTSVASVFRAIFDYPKYSSRRSRIRVLTDKGKEFLNKINKKPMLRDEGGN